MSRLLDVNVLIALAWPTHVHHGPAARWFVDSGHEGWATCPVTESGFIRLSSNPRVVEDARTPGEAAGLLARYRELDGHVFWPDAVSLATHVSLVNEAVLGSSMVTDAHLLLVATANGGSLATFDRGVMALAERLGANAELIV